MFYEYICSVRDREVRDSKYLSRRQSSPSCLVAVKRNYSSDTTTDLNFKNKIKVEIEPKILLHATLSDTRSSQFISLYLKIPLFPGFGMSKIFPGILSKTGSWKP